MKKIDQITFMIGLEIFYPNHSIPLTNRFQIGFKRARTIQFWLSPAEQIEIRPVDDIDVVDHEQQ